MSGPGFVQGVPDFDKLQLVVVGYTSISSDGSTVGQQTIPHNLGYKPSVMAFLNNVDVSGSGGLTISSVDIPLPTYASTAIDTGGTPQVRFTTWIHAMANNTNLYILTYNATGSSFSLPIKYYLLRERSS